MSTTHEQPEVPEVAFVPKLFALQRRLTTITGALMLGRYGARLSPSYLIDQRVNSIRRSGDPSGGHLLQVGGSGCCQCGE